MWSGVYQGARFVQHAVAAVAADVGADDQEFSAIAGQVDALLAVPDNGAAAHDGLAVLHAQAGGRVADGGVAEVGRPVAVNPSTRLYLEALRRGWEIRRVR